MSHAGSCAHIPGVVGDAALLAGLAGLVVGLYATPLAIAAAAVLEVLARRRA